MKNRKVIIAISIFLLSIILAFISGKFLVSTNSSKIINITSVSAQEFKKEIDDKGVVILDIRTAEEFNKGKIAGAINIDFYKSDFQNNLEKLDKNSSYKIYCNSGNRSSKALEMMRQLGFTDVTELSGGIKAWISNNYSVCVDC